MKPRYKEEKTAQMAALFLKMRGGKMSYIKLLKLMYMVDREALARLGRPVSYDSFSSMEHGPVLSTTYNRMKGENTFGRPEPAWEKYITTRQGYDVKLKKEAPVSELSAAEIKLIEEVFEQFGNWYRWKIVDYMHDNFPEWKDPGDSSTPIDYAEVLRAKQKSPEETAEIEAEIAGLAVFERLTA
ncbi:MAG TPA: Panacea domain-containing protein [Pyrinomonadaceae bacterium]|nr:Panacea domain-containing protein [Pyrinomonadaceae bacterium]